MQETDTPESSPVAQILSIIGFLLFIFVVLDSFGALTPTGGTGVDIKSRDIIAVTLGVVLFVMAMVASRKARESDDADEE